MTDMRTDNLSESTKMIRVDISKSLDFIGLPLITFEKDGESLTFLLDTGASMNLIKKTVLDHFSHDAEQLPQKTQYYGIDNVCHETHMYTFTFRLGDFEYCEPFQEIQDADALKLDMEDGYFEIHGILSSQFFMKYRACFSYDTMEMFFTAPDNSNWCEKSVRSRHLPLQPDTKFNPLNSDAMGYYDEETYDEYNGTYVQDVEGWSDQMIDDALDGEPDAYWNID